MYRVIVPEFFVPFTFQQFRLFNPERTALFEPYIAIFILFAVIAILEFFIGSGTAKAFLIMPLVAPLSDLVGITRQSVVTTFCMADGFTNLLYPTSGLMILAIGMVGVSYKNWLKWSWKLFVVLGIISAGFMLMAVGINYK